MDLTSCSFGWNFRLAAFFPAANASLTGLVSVGCRLSLLCIELLLFSFCVSAGLDASAQTTSHELTIPNDVSILQR